MVWMLCFTRSHKDGSLARTVGQRVGQEVDTLENRLRLLQEDHARRAERYAHVPGMEVPDTLKLLRKRK